jgi:hypothetical protein
MVEEQFSDIGPHGTKIIVFNLWSNDNGVLELDFDSREEVSIRCLYISSTTLCNCSTCWSSIHNNEILFSFNQDIMISGAPNPAETKNDVKRMNENHMANQLRCSLRVSDTWLTIYLL